MLARLSIRNIVLIDELDLQLNRGLTVLTGETGAGKSILLDAFALALGGRGDGSLVRAGQASGQVSAVFEPPADHPALRIAADLGLDVEGDLILRRMQMADGRTRAFVNDQPVGVQALRALGAALVEIHGQHDDRALVDAATHRALVDQFGALSGLVVATRDAHAAWRAAETELAEERARVERARADADYLRHAHEDLSQLAPRPGEEEALATTRTAMMQAEKVAGELAEARDALSGDHSPIPALAGLLRRLERRAGQAPALIEPPVKAIDAAIEALELAAQSVEASLRETNFDPNELERIEERLFALRGAGRKYSTPVDNLADLARKFADDLAAIDAGEARLIVLEKERVAARQRLDDAAAALSRARVRAARQLDKSVNAELPPLKLERATFSTEIVSDPATPGPDGVDRVEFVVQTNPGSRPGPLMKVASGGELARFMLALKVALADRGSAPTLVFDEIDTGVGGAVADAIGQRLARLATGAQVLAVTHAPQVAARALAHFRIAKDLADRGKSVATRVTHLPAAARKEEIARMLSGATVTDEARAAAGKLLAGAEN